MFEKFDNRIIISGVLENLPALHIGSAYARGSESDTDSPVIKDVDSKPIIPGSSFKGALRATVERIASGLGMKCCYITSKENSLLFSMDISYQTDLENGEVSDGMRSEFANNGVSLSEDIMILDEMEDRRWSIEDANRKYYVLCLSPMSRQKFGIFKV